MEGVEVYLGDQCLVQVSTRVAPGEVLTVMGPSGVGKSSLLAYINGTLAASFTAKGHIALNGRTIHRLPPHRRRVGMLYQDDLLFPHLSVGGNLAFGLGAKGGRRFRLRRIHRALAQAGLEGFAQRDPATLSGGQRARVAVLRVLLSEPEALLLDEPFGKLDAHLRQQFRQFVFDQARLAGLPMVLVTHDAQDARAAGGPVIHLAANGEHDRVDNGGGDGL